MADSTLKSFRKFLIGSPNPMKRRNPGWGCPRIAQQISLAFGVAMIRTLFAVC
jgi:hypothetical protein